MPEPITDPVAEKLRTIPVANAVRAAAWDAFEQASNEDDLAVKLKPLALPQHIKAELWDLKLQQSARQPRPDNQPPDRAAAARALGSSLIGPEAYEVFSGTVKRGLQTVNQMADWGREHIPGMAALDKIVPPAEVNFERTTPLQKVGAAGEQILEVLSPSRAITAAGMKTAAALAPKIAPVIGQTAARIAPRAAVEAAGAAGLSAAQGGDPAVGAVAGAMVPVVGAAASKAAPWLKETASKQVMQALGPTKERFKAIAERRTPEILKRRLGIWGGGSREALLQQAGDTVERVGEQIDEAIEQYGARPVQVKPIIEELETAKQQFVNYVPALESPGVSHTTVRVFERADASPAEIFSHVLSDAKRQGYPGSPTVLRKIFNERLDEAKALREELTDIDGEFSPRALLKAIAKAGGLGADRGYPGEIAQLWQHSTGLAVGKGFSKAGTLRQSRTLGAGAISGVSGVMRKGGKSLDEMAESLRQDQRFSHIDGPNTLLDAIEDARINPGGAPTLGRALQMTGVTPGKKWWQATDEAHAGLEAVEFDPRSVRQLSRLQGILKRHGDEMRVDQLVAIRRAWDKVVAQAGGFAHRAPGAIGMPLKEQTEAWAKREATGAIRRLLDMEVPELSVLNKEYSFWKDLDDVLDQTLKRTQPHGQGLISKTAEVGGQIVGAAKGGLAEAFVLGKVAKMANAVFTSPRWRFVSANLKDRLADAIMSGRTEAVTSALGRISAVEGSKIPAAMPAY